MDENKMAKGLFFGFLAGGIVGAAIALLYAPKSGKDLRADIAKKKDEILDDASEYMQIAKEKATELINDGKKKSEQLIQDAKSKAGNIIDDANKVLADAKDKAADKIVDVREKITTEADRIKEAFKAGVEAYNDEKNKI